MPRVHTWCVGFVIKQQSLWWSAGLLSLRNCPSIPWQRNGDKGVIAAHGDVCVITPQQSSKDIRLGTWLGIDQTHGGSARDAELRSAPASWLPKLK